MKLNFKEVKIKKIDNEEIVVDLSKEVGNLIYNNTRDLGEVEIARKIYLNGIVEMEREEAKMLIDSICNLRINGEQVFPAIYQIAIKNLIKKEVITRNSVEG